MDGINVTVKDVQYYLCSENTIRRLPNKHYFFVDVFGTIFGDGDYIDVYNGINSGSTCVLIKDLTDDELLFLKLYDTVDKCHYDQFSSYLQRLIKIETLWMITD